MMKKCRSGPSPSDALYVANARSLRSFINLRRGTAPFFWRYLVQVQPEKWCSASSNIPLSIFLFDSFNLDLVSMNEAFVHARTIFQVGTLYNEESIHIGNISTQS